MAGIERTPESQEQVFVTLTTTIIFKSHRAASSGTLQEQLGHPVI